MTAEPSLVDVGLAERRRLIVELLGAHGYVAVRELSERFAVTTMTIRADLDALAANRLLLRVHGGAIRVATTQQSPGPR